MNWLPEIGKDVKNLYNRVMNTSPPLNNTKLYFNVRLCLESSREGEPCLKRIVR